MAHQIFRSSCSITPLAVPVRCRSASLEAERRRAYRLLGMRGASSSENSIQGQDRPSGDGTDSYQQALRHRARHGRGGRCPAIPDAPVAKPGFLEQLKARLDKTPPQVTSSKCLGQAINCLASNWLKLIRYIERGTPAHRQQPCRAGEPPSHVHMTKASPVSSRYVMPTHDGVLTVSVRQSIVFPKGA